MQRIGSLSIRILNSETMDKEIRTKNRPARFSLRGLTIQQRLPLLICTLLLCVIIGFSLASYYSVRNSAMGMGRERIRSLANQLGSMLSQSTTSLLTSIKKTADNDTLRQCLVSGGKQLHTEALDILKRTRRDSTNVLIELLDPNSLSVLSYSEAEKDLQNKLSRIWKPATEPAGSNADKVEKMFGVNNSTYFPTVATITDKKQIIGYLVSWTLLTTTQESVEVISKLMGKGATLYIGNSDQSFWTDMMKPVPPPPIVIKKIDSYFEYADPNGNDVIAAAQLIANSDWLVLIEFSKQTILEGATRFLKWIMIIGGLLIIIGIIIARIVSHNITSPLKALTKAAAAVSKGDYSWPVEVDRNDELGKLANAFSIMTDQVYATQLNLENKVMERTAQLEIVNKELEAFSYSVSHDLRAPLRGVMGFTTLLEEHYGNNLDDEAKRITSVIKANALKMGDLIDDLLNFSRMGRHDIVKTNIQIQEMVKEVIAGFEPENKNNVIKWNIGTLPPITGDVNTIKQVWVNLISNAIKYSGRKDQSIIEIGSFMHDGQTAFFVKDNGVGFDERYKDKLFKVFQRLHSSREFEGTGVGLAIVEKIISKHGGNVWAEAAVDKGASFYFSLPTH